VFLEKLVKSSIRNDYLDIFKLIGGTQHIDTSEALYYSIRWGSIDICEYVWSKIATKGLPLTYKGGPLNKVYIEDCMGNGFFEIYEWMDVFKWAMKNQNMKLLDYINDNVTISELDTGTEELNWKEPYQYDGFNIYFDCKEDRWRKRIKDIVKNRHQRSFKPKKKAKSKLQKVNLRDELWELFD